jgi:hypothetical protein
LFVAGSLVWLTGHTKCEDADYRQILQHDSQIVPQKPIDTI